MLQDQLIEKCRQNSRQAQFELYNKYSQAMFRVSSRFLKDPYEAEDAMQEAFIQAFLKLNQYKGEVGFGAWLKKIVINKCLDHLKVRKLATTALNENILVTVEEEKNWKIEEGVGVAEVKSAIGQLPENYKYPLMLFLMEGYDHQEISEIMKISEVASRTLVHRGKKKLQEQLKSKRHGTGY